MTRILADVPPLDFPDLQWHASRRYPRRAAAHRYGAPAHRVRFRASRRPHPDPALAALADSIAQIDGVQDAVAVAPYDGSPTAKSLTVRIYLDEPTTGDLAAITTEALQLAWRFTDFKPASYTAQVWNGTQQSPPYDNSKRVDLTTVFPELDLPDSRVYKGDLYPSISDLEAKFGPRE